MNPVKAHYDQLLGSVYSWILGDFETARENNARLFETLGIERQSSGTAVDLGSGPGCQALPLADLGFDVTAIDFCAELLDELRTHAGGDRVTTVLDDILNFRSHLDRAPELIVCMGDTLVHLPDRTSASQLLRNAAAALAENGSLVISLRDYDAPGPEGPDRFIPIRSSEDRIFTCFLEYEIDVVRVHDILQRRVNGEWQLSISDYQKLRLGIDWVAEILVSEGLGIARRMEANGMLVLHARKSTP